MNQFNPFFTNPDTFLARIFSEKNLKFVAHVVNPINEPTEVRFYLDSLTLNPKGVSLKITPVSKYIIGVRETGFNFYIIDKHRCFVFGVCCTKNLKQFNNRNAVGANRHHVTCIGNRAYIDERVRCQALACSWGTSGEKISPSAIRTWDRTDPPRWAAPLVSVFTTL